jgi:hypothetical protein
MAALAPSLNGAGVPLPPNPENPPSLIDITNAKEYVDRLSFSKGQPSNSAHTILLIRFRILITAACQPNAATDGDIGAAEAYKTAVVLTHSPGANVAPPWLANLNATVQQIAADVAFLRRRSEEMPILLANSQAGTRGPLYNPTAMANGWAPYLVPPNPRTRDELLAFTSWFNRSI